MQSSRSGVLLNHFPLDFIERGCLLNMELTKDQAGCPENFRDPSVSASLVLRCQTQVAKPGSYIGARDPNIGPPQTCTPKQLIHLPKSKTKIF